MTERNSYPYSASTWTHHTPYQEKPRPGVYCPYYDYEPFPGWQVVILINSQQNADPYQGSFEPNELCKIIKNFQECGYNVLLDGAEPLAKPDFLKAFKEADQKILTTNGMTICERPALIDEIREAGIETLGVYYHFEAQAIFSPVHLGLAKTALKLAENVGIRGRVMTTIIRPNLEKIPDYCAWCVKEGFTEICFTNFIAQDRYSRPEHNVILSEDDRKRYYEIITEQRAKYPEEVLNILSSGTFGVCGSPHMYCTAMRESVVFTPDYKIYPCIHQISPGNECGIYVNGHIFTKKNYPTAEHDCAALHLFNH